MPRLEHRFPKLAVISYYPADFTIAKIPAWM